MSVLHPQLTDSTNPIQTDSGAKIGITDTLDILVNVHNIPPLKVGHASKTGPPIFDTMIDDIELICDDGTIILTPMYYSPSALGTILSPDHIC